MGVPMLFGLYIFSLDQPARRFEALTYPPGNTWERLVLFQQLFRVLQFVDVETVEHLTSSW